MNMRKFLPLCAVFLLSLVLAVSCTPTPSQSIKSDPVSRPVKDASAPIVMGYSNWAGWWPWAIAEQEGLFEANGVNVELKWFDSYLESLEAMAAGKLDANCQTLNDTIAFSSDSVNDQVAVLVNDNSAGNDKIIVSQEINTMQDLKGKKVVLEEGLVDDFLLSLALKKNGMSREDIEIINLETGKAAAVFASGKADAVGAFPPFWLTAFKREGSKELVSSKEFPGAIPDLLVVNQNLIEQRPAQVQALVNTWFAVLDFMKKNPQKAVKIMAKRANVSSEEFQQFQKGVKMFTIKDNLEAFGTFASGNDLKYMPYAAKGMTTFMLDVGLIQQSPDLDKLFNDKFVKDYAANS